MKVDFSLEKVQLLECVCKPLMNRYMETNNNVTESNRNLLFVLNTFKKYIIYTSLIFFLIQPTSAETQRKMNIYHLL